MTEIIVVTPFRDKEDFSRIHRPGETLLFEDGRAAEAVSRGLCKLVSPAASPARPEKAPLEGEPKVEVSLIPEITEPASQPKGTASRKRAGRRPEE